jgi:hypothetical protein
MEVNARQKKTIVRPGALFSPQGSVTYWQGNIHDIMSPAPATLSL